MAAPFWEFVGYCAAKVAYLFLYKLQGTVSKIVPLLDEGAAVTTSRNDIDYVVTEYGIAKLSGRTLKERAKALIEIAHPDFREGLKKVYEERFHCAY